MKKNKRLIKTALFTLTAGVFLFFLALSANDASGSQGKFYRLKNRWTGEYMHIENKTGYVQLAKNGPGGEWWSSQWSKEDMGSGYFRLKNRWTGEYMHIENKPGRVQLAQTGPGGEWWSSQWLFESAD